MSSDSSRRTGSTKRKAEQSRGSEPPSEGRADPKLGARLKAKSIRVSNQAEQQAREAAKSLGGPEAAEAGKGEAELPMSAGPPAREIIESRVVLPAWVASYTNPGTIALLRSGGSQALPESIIQGEDDRQKVAETQDTKAFPWRCICRLDITAKDGSAWLGTGWLASPKTVITAGHCVYLKDAGGWAERITVTPAYNDGEAPFGSVDSSDLHSTEQWKSGNQEDPATQPFDYGAIVLPQALSVGFFGYAAESDDALKLAQVNVYGYPGDKDGGSALWGYFRKLYQVSANEVFYTIATAGGESGCPVFIKDGETRTVVGIHNYGGVQANQATRITDDVFDNIEAWKQ